jgi:starch phosphorylase
MDKVEKLDDVEKLEEKMLKLSQNLWWTWHPEAIDVWRSIDHDLWRECRHSPIAFMKRLGKDNLKKICKTPRLLIKLHRVLSDLNRYMEPPSTWGCIKAGPLKARPVIYFCAEFGIHESLPLYSGGLGVLAGDHLKSASDLGIPTIGVSLFYRGGYFRQGISETGDQIADFELLNPEDLPLTRVKAKDGRPLTIEIPIREKTVQIGAWTAHLGRVPIYFLDMETAFRKMGIQELGLRLYGGDESVRLSQEIVLGIGGMRLILNLGINPGVIHLNEGHCAFAILEYARHLMEEHSISFRNAKKQAGSHTVFTTHTPVAAGHDRFSSDLIGQTTWQFRKSLGLSHEGFMDLGRVHQGDKNEPFCMTVLALRTAGKSNAVSSIHGKVSRLMWANLWPDRSFQHIPIGHITNGINVLGWLIPSMKRLFHRYFPPDWENRIGEEGIWHHIHTIPDEELWNTLLSLKTKLIEFLPRRPHRAHPKDTALDPHALTIGFARRFTGYKRANLLLEDPDRLWRILSNPERPVQIIFSGKAHPKDNIGKDHIKQVYKLVMNPRVPGKAVFIEDYDINVCRHMVQGVDLWLNTPSQGHEASGTSGMKVALNGGLNLSILDGWWPEGYNGSNGFAILGSKHENYEIRDARDREAIFNALEEEIIPLYYQQDEQGIPRKWVHQIKQAMCTLGWRFSSDRMVMDYVNHCYMQTAGISTCQMNIPFV